jgi:hypothetical protein
VIDESDPQPEKHDDPRISTLDGIMIVRSDVKENADDPIRVNREFDANVIDVRNTQFIKQFDLRT